MTQSPTKVIARICVPKTNACLKDFDFFHFVVKAFPNKYFVYSPSLYRTGFLKSDSYNYMEEIRVFFDDTGGVSSIELATNLKQDLAKKAGIVFGCFPEDLKNLHIYLQVLLEID